MSRWPIVTAVTSLASMLKLNEVKTILRKYDIRPNKRLGQNFLIDQNIQKKIIDALELQGSDTVLEIGPGLGALTKELCKRAKKVIAIEKDRRLYDFFLKEGAYNNLELVRGDILDYDFPGVAANRDTKIKVVGNLPYCISSPALVKFLENREYIDSIFVALQKEFAERVVAREGSKIYGAISCFVRFYAEPDFLFTIKKKAFYPTPQVDSSFLRIRIRDRGLYLTDEEKLFKIIKAGFGKRRKTILNSLYSSDVSTSKEDIVKKLKIAGISHTRRAETISLGEFVRLTEAGLNHDNNKEYS
ncbi:16S rRNA (adenine(1518)-N(6)/adenine(1519)-N(6))-dimethyltransferase RsmA [Candidatus Omnitrophota bacterium]